VPRHRHTWSLLFAAVLAFAGCGGSDSFSPLPQSPSPSPDGFVDETYFHDRQLDYLRFATRVEQPRSVMNALAHMERSRVDAGYAVPFSVPADAWDRSFAKMAALEDTRDFDGLYLLNILLGYRDHPALPAALVQKLEEAFIAFKFWYTEPTPPGMLDNSYYWTENHQVLYHAIEFLAGQLYPDRAFSSDGKTGREHREHARQMLLRWLDLRARFGFTEWHSNVYYQKDVTPLLTLVEYATDEEIRSRSAMVLDLLLYDMAMHTFRGAFGVTHGRSYKKDKNSSLDDDTWGLVKLLFNTTEYPYQGEDPGAALFARAQRYRMPEAILRVARTQTPFVDRERMGINLDELAPYQENPVVPYGFSFSDPNELTVWWGMGAMTAWQVIPLTVRTMSTYNLWHTTNFAPYAELEAFASDVGFAQRLAARSARFFCPELLKEVNTYTYRTADYMLSSAQDYRKGSFGSQYHSWQATFDANALVFTTHPFRPLVQTLDWNDDSESGGYWTGEASMPRSAQHENVAVHIYAPQYKQRNPAPFDFFHYEPYTHAYFPQDHFDEVVRQGSWTFGHFRDGYIALYSFRPTQWIAYDPTVIATNGMVKPFDLRAEGGADNVWIAECGNAQRWGSFAAFRAAITASNVQVTSLGQAQPGISNGFDIVYDSPSQGRLTFGWEAPFVVNGSEVPIAGFARYDDPWSQTAHDARTMQIADDGYGIRLDFEKGTRTVLGP